jgi:hypothetical protein
VGAVGGGNQHAGNAGRDSGAGGSAGATSSFGGSAAGSGGGAVVGGGPQPTAGSSSGGDSADGGAGGVGGTDSCQSKTDGEIRAWLYQEITTSISNELHPFLALTTTGNDVPLAQLAIRYYFTAEMSGDWQVDCIWVTAPGGSGSGLCDSGTTMKIVSLDPPRDDADHYLEVSFAQVSSGTLSSVPTPVFEARSMFWRAGHPMMNQDNDYSFVPTTSDVLEVEERAYKQTTRVTVYRNGGLVWGEEPCP